MTSMNLQICKQQHVKKCPCVENVVSDDFSNSKKSCRKWESWNQAVLPIFIGYALVLLLFAWEISARVNYTWCCTLQLQWVWHSCLAQNIHSRTCLWISHPKSHPLTLGSLKQFCQLRFANQQKRVLLCWKYQNICITEFSICLFSARPVYGMWFSLSKCSGMSLVC